jgi:hypothetical protein
MLVESLREIGNNARTLEEAQDFADDALDLYQHMKELNRGGEKK